MLLESQYAGCDGPGVNAEMHGQVKHALQAEAVR